MLWPPWSRIAPPPLEPAPTVRNAVFADMLEKKTLAWPPLLNRPPPPSRPMVSVTVALLASIADRTIEESPPLLYTAPPPLLPDEVWSSVNVFPPTVALPSDTWPPLL